MLYFVFTVDGDWEEYFYYKKPIEKRLPNKKQFLDFVNQEIKFAQRELGGHFIHFIHTSPISRAFFLQPEFIDCWKRIEQNGGSIGIHCHEEYLRQAYYYDDAARMEQAIGDLVTGLTEQGLKPLAYRGGYLSFSNKLIPILEENGIFLDFTSEPGRYFFHGQLLVSDWRHSPINFYRLSYEDYRQPGQSRVFEVPLGIHLERYSLWRIWQQLSQFKQQEGPVVVSVLAHSYTFSGLLKRLRLKLLLLILMKYGRFISGKDALKIISQGEA